MKQKVEIKKYEGSPSETRKTEGTSIRRCKRSTLNAQRRIPDLRKRNKESGTHQSSPAREKCDRLQSGLVPRHDRGCSACEKSISATRSSARDRSFQICKRRGAACLGIRGVNLPSQRCGVGSPTLARSTADRSR